MSHMINLVRVLTAATGNSTPITLGAAYSQLFMTPAEAGAIDGRTYSYLIVDGNNFELGRGVYTASGTTLSRNVLQSRISGTLGTTRISLSGTAQVRIVDASEDKGSVSGTRPVAVTSDVLMNSDLNQVVTYSNASPVAVSLAQAGASNAFLDGWLVWVKNKGVGAVTITPATSTIDGAATLVLQQNQGALIWSDGTNYQSLKFRGDLGVVGTTAGTLAAGDDARFEGGLGLQNCSIGASVASNILTVSLLTANGSTPSAASPCRINFRSATTSSGAITTNVTTTATSISTFATGATLGSVNAAAFRFWVVAFDNAGTTVLGLINCSTSTQIVPLDETAVASTTAISGSATLAGTFYTPNGTALTSKAFRILGYIEYGASGLTTAGTYASAPAIVQLFGPGIKKPGDVVQPVFVTFGSQNSTTSNSYVDSGLTASVTLRSAANLVRSEYSTIVVIGTPGEIITTMMHQDGAAIGSTAQYSTTASGFNYTSVNGLAFNRPNKTTTATYVVRFKNSSNSNAVYFGNSVGSTMALSEIMG